MAMMTCLKLKRDHDTVNGIMNGYLEFPRGKLDMYPHKSQ